MNPMSSAYSQALAALVKAYVHSDDLPQATQLLPQITDTKHYIEASHLVAAHYCDQQQFVHALNLYPSVTLDEFIYTIATLIHRGRQRQITASDSLARHIAFHAIEIAGWTESSWKQMLAIVDAS